MATTTLNLDIVSQTITNGVTTKAPSEDAVFDALAGKENAANKQNSLAVDGTGTKYPTVDALNSFKVASQSELEQKDFVQIAKGSVSQNEMYYRKVDVNNLSSLHRITSTKYFKSDMIKDVNDDFYKLAAQSIVTVNIASDIFTGRKNTPLDLVTEVGGVPNLHTITVGDKIYATFTGTKIEFRHYADTRGGLWRFTVDGDTTNQVDVSTYSSSVGYKISALFSGLESTEHYIEGEFLGDDPLNPPSSTARGWFVRNINEIEALSTFIIYDDVLQVATETMVLTTTSNKEFAISAKIENSINAHEFIPDHGVGNTFGTTEILIDDNINFFDQNNVNGYLPCRKVEVKQDMLAKNSFDNIDLIDIKTTHVFTFNNVEINCCLEFLQNTDILTGYVNMIPVSISTFGDLLVDSRMNSFDLSITDGSSTPAPYKDNLKSIAVIDSISDEFLAISFNGNLDTFLKDRTSYRSFSGFETRFWLQHRDANINKLYPQTYSSEVIPQGFIHQTQMTISIGSLSNAFYLFKKPIL